MSSPFFVKLKNRGAVFVSGPDRRSFLQGLVTNDVYLLDSQPCVYACLLTPQGKFLHDFFMTEQGDTIVLECEGGDRAQDLMTRLSHFKLRSKVTLERIEEKDVFQIICGPGQGPENSLPDPRHTSLGFRSFQPPAGLPEHPFEDWDYLRILHTVPDGSRDLVTGQSTLEDGHIDRLNGVSYTKGCYMGQELTARIHYRGLAKRHLITIKNANTGPFPDFGTQINSKDIILGEMRSSCREIGLALIKDNAIPALTTAGYETIVL